MLYTSDTSRYTKIVYTGMYLVYLVPAYKEKLISTVCFFLAISELLAISYLRAFIIAIYGNLNSSYPLFFTFSHLISKLCKSGIWYCHM